MKNFVLFLITGFLLLSGCSKKLDATSEKTLWASAETIAESLSAEKKEEFVEAFDKVGHHYLFAVDSEEEMKKIFHNKSANQIIKLAKEIEKKELKEKLDSQPKLDASTFESLIQSKVNAERELSWEEIRELDQAMVLIINTYKDKESEKKFLARFNKKTPAEIISDSKKISKSEKKTVPKKKPWD